MKTIYFRAVMLFAVMCLAPVAYPQPQSTPVNKPIANSDKQQKDRQSHQDEDDGQRIFEANCSRCHNAPEGFSARISGTIVRHMRVRASLSAHDEQELLRFFNP